MQEEGCQELGKEIMRVQDLLTESVNDGSNISVTGNEKAMLQRKHRIRPGTPEWFQLWFSLPFMTGEKPIDPKNS